MKNFFYLVCLYLFLAIPNQLSAQYLTEEEPAKRKFNVSDKLVFGGNFGLSLGTVDYVELSPKVGYRFTPRFTTGVGIKYIYYHEDIEYFISGQRYKFSYESKVYGGSLWAKYDLFQNLNESIGINIGDIFLYGELEELNVESYDPDLYGMYEITGRTWVTCPLVGAGIFQPIGRRGGVYFTILFNLNDELYSPYDNPIWRIGFNF